MVSVYLEERIERYVSELGHPITILEVGAGNGRLAHFIRQKLRPQFADMAAVIATDSGEMGLETYFPVEMIDHEQVLKKYRPEIVIESWMPRGVDLTKDFRAAPSVREYILIGDEESTGHPWYTWGDSYSLSSEEMDLDSEQQEALRFGRERQWAPYREEGFERERLCEDYHDKNEVKNPISHQLSRGRFVECGGNTSTAVSFRRVMR